MKKCHSSHMKVRKNGSAKVTIDIPPDELRAFYAVANLYADRCLAVLAYDVTKAFVRDTLQEMAEERRKKETADASKD